MQYVCSLENVKYFKLFQVEGRKAIHFQIQKYQQFDNKKHHDKHGKKTRNHLNKMKDQKNFRNESKNQADLGNNASTLVSTK